MVDEVGKNWGNDVHKELSYRFTIAKEAFIMGTSDPAQTSTARTLANKGLKIMQEVVNKLDTGWEMIVYGSENSD